MTTYLDVDLYAENGAEFYSSNLDQIGYDRESKTLYVEFQSGPEVYGYEGVEESTYNLLVTAPSVGRFYTQHIQGNYTSTKYDADHVIVVRDEADEVSTGDGNVISQEQANTLFVSGNNAFINSVVTVPQARYGVKWENTEGTIGGHPEYQAMSERDALAQCRAAIEAAGIDGYKIVSVTHYLG